MSLADTLKAARESKAPEQIDIEDVTGKPIPKEIQLAAARAVVAQGRQSGLKPVKRQPSPASTRGKSSNPEYEAVKVLVKAEYRKQATRRWQDEPGNMRKDFSDLIEHLLIRYLGA